MIYLAVRAFGWTPAQIAETDMGLLEALLMMHGEFERTLAERLKRQRR